MRYATVGSSPSGCGGAVVRWLPPCRLTAKRTLKRGSLRRFSRAGPDWASACPALLHGLLGQRLVVLSLICPTGLVIAARSGGSGCSPPRSWLLVEPPVGWVLPVARPPRAALSAPRPQWVLRSRGPGGCGPVGAHSSGLRRRWGAGAAGPAHAARLPGRVDALSVAPRWVGRFAVRPSCAPLLAGLRCSLDLLERSTGRPARLGTCSARAAASSGLVTSALPATALLPAPRRWLVQCCPAALAGGHHAGLSGGPLGPRRFGLRRLCSPLSGAAHPAPPARRWRKQLLAALPAFS